MLVPSHLLVGICCVHVGKAVFVLQVKQLQLVCRSFEIFWNTGSVSCGPLVQLCP